MGLFRNLQAICEVADVEMRIYGRGRNRTLALQWNGVVRRVHYSKATQDQAAEVVARQMTLDGSLPPGMAFKATLDS